MSFQRLSLGMFPKLPLILQTEAAECGLACLAMVAQYFGYASDLTTLRRRFSISIRGATLTSLISIANRLGMRTRAVRFEPQDIDQLKLPCILHWRSNHFVVLKSRRGDKVTVLDPASGELKYSMESLADLASGAALELWPGEEFQRRNDKTPIRISNIVGRVHGLVASAGQVLALAIVLELFSLLHPQFMQWVIDKALLSGTRDLLVTLAIGFGLLVVLNQTTSALRSWLMVRFSTMFSFQWRENVFSHLLSLPMDYFEKRHLGDISSRFGAVETIQRFITSSFLEAIIDGLMSSVMLVVLFLYSPLLASICLVTVTLYALGRAVWFHPLRRATEEQISHAAKQQSHFLETMRGVKAIRLFGIQDQRRAHWLNLVVDEVNSGLKTQRLFIHYRLLSNTLTGIEHILIVTVGASLVLDAQLTVGMLMAFVAYKMQFGSRVMAFIDKFFELRMLRVQAERLSDIVHTEPDDTASGGLASGIAANNLDASVEVRNLRFRYAEHEKYVLDGISFVIRPGESVALVGASGCGKTTLVNVLLGINEPTEGEIIVGGLKMNRSNKDAIRQVIGTVLQDDSLFAGSIAENISFFDQHEDQSRIETCARQSAIHEEVVAMPMGYNSIIGYMGSTLSGGQKQRVLLARALYRNPRILILDEATSHLDLVNEAMVAAAINDLAITRIIIAHRPETIASADRVLVIEQGQIVSDSHFAESIAIRRKSLQRDSASN